MQNHYQILKKINSPRDLKKLTEKELYRLSQEIRRYIIEVVSSNGGHLASNLGVVELTIALHRVFDSPHDKIIWDVGHQSYTHKILTGRNKAFKTIRKLKGLSGFPKRTESVHDIFDTGHSSTSISAALGIRACQDILKTGGKVIAVIGDGSLTGGMAFEALNHAGHLGKDLIIILNDNNMSIGQNVGAVAVYLTELTTTRYYQIFRRGFDGLVKKLPFIGKKLLEYIYRLKRGLKAFLFKANIFADMGFEYVGPIDGHNIHVMIHMLENIKKLEKPVVLHVSTHKGRGYTYAEGNPTLYHGVGAFSIVNGKVEKKSNISFTEAFSQSLLKLAEKNNRIVAISAAMTLGTGLSEFEKRYPRRFFDVGICEQHAVTFAAGLANQGLRPVVAIYSTFMQRAVDQVIHDIALQNLPVTICMDRAGLVGADGETHHGVFDIALFHQIPRITFLAPADQTEMELMLKFALKYKGPVLLRYPRTSCPQNLQILKTPLVKGRGVFATQRRGGTLLITLGGTLPGVLEASLLLKGEGITADVYNLRFIKPLDLNYLLSIMYEYSFIFFIEDGIARGGIGEYIAALLIQNRVAKPFEVIGIPDSFIEHGQRQELLDLCGLSSAKIARKVRERITRPGQLTLIKESNLNV